MKLQVSLLLVKNLDYLFLNPWSDLYTFSYILCLTHSFFIYFMLHILLSSLILFSRFIPSAFISYHPHPCPVLNYCFLPWLPANGYLPTFPLWSLLLIHSFFLGEKSRLFFQNKNQNKALFCSKCCSHISVTQ